MSQPFPLLVICDMMGIPRNQFQTVLDATNVILGAGDPEFIGDRDFLGALFEAGMELISLLNALAEERRKEPTDDLTYKLVHNDVGEEMLDTAEIGHFVLLPAVPGNATPPTEQPHRMTRPANNT